MNIQTTANSPVDAPRIERVRFDLRRRSLRVERSIRLTPGMLRIVFSGDELHDFASLAPDDHIKIFVPTPSGEVVPRSYTPRRYDAEARTLDIDFALHDAGPATNWAIDARPGDRLEVGGPKGSTIVSPDIRHWLLIGDETALPAIARRIEEAREGTRMTSIVAVTGPQEHLVFDTRADLLTLWAHRSISDSSDPSTLLAILKTIGLLPGTFVWIAAEALVTRAIRSFLVQERGHPLSWMKASGYWVMGRADAHEKFE
ncbi:siderophore-interacting protein [Mesorhizobium sp. 1M-11]|uniref:siderophore-interacting protein n=1 Tax=Mesorhizobium sp. 1M-11 TaxID=1529006 RepID=UPI0006C74DFA|nr:siderophore-interacting protein [Mesorhizobium sp. 1M-11]